MRSISRVFAVLVSAVLFAGCGASSAGPSAPAIPNGYSPQSVAMSDSVDALGGPPQVLYVSQPLGNVTVYKQKGTNQVPIRTITNGIDRPAGLFVNTNGDLYVANVGGQSITVYKRGASTPYRTLSDTGEVPNNATVDSSGVVYVCNYETTTTGSGSVSIYAAGSDVPTSSLSVPSAEFILWCALDNQHNLYVGYWLGSGPLGVWEFPGGSGPGQTLKLKMKFPGQMDFDAKQNMVLADEASSTADVFKLPSGFLAKTIATPSGGTIVGLSLNARANHLWVADHGSSAVYEFAYPKGTLLDTITPPPTGGAPSGVAADPPAPL